MRLAREELEELAIESVCACFYYELRDTIEEMSEEDLVKIIERKRSKIDYLDTPSSRSEK